ncbi:MAG TPA: glycosyltransferase [Reyranella sp.]|jgi:glycosyltransferase involved in cell wall biosynthesis|nr:glycosyltransferase [Reyranella sp.]
MTSSGDSGGGTKLRVGHSVGFYFPENVGGTEVYVRDLADGLIKLSVGSTIVAATDRAYEEYEWSGVPVRRYPSNWADIESDSVSSSGQRLSKFQQIVARAGLDVFHLHSWTAGAGLKHLEQVVQLGIPCIVTVHVPSALCMRGTMLLEGSRPCDGRIDELRCTRCWALSRGLPMAAARTLSLLPRIALPQEVSRRLGRLGTVVSARSLVHVQKRDLHKMSELSARIVAPSEWVRAALAENGVPQQKMFVSRQAVADSLVRLGQTDARSRREVGALRIGFVGRLEPYKGPHVLLHAMAALPKDVPLRLIVAGSGTEPPYLRMLEELAAGDERIEFLGPISHDDLPDFLKSIDVLAVPSNYMETGPLVVLEAYAFGIPVMGANIGGIAERIRDGVDGWLLPFNDSGAWAKAMRDVAFDRAKLQRLAANIGVARTMSDVASEMAAIYTDIASTGLTIEVGD